MKAIIFCTILAVLLLEQGVLQAQDFLLRGCYGTCSDSTNNWMKKLREQAPDLAYRGFTYVWLPKVAPAEKTAFAETVKTLRKAGLEPLMDLTIPNGATIFQMLPLSEQLRNNFQIRSFRIHSEETPKPVIIANFLSEYYKQNPDANLVFTDILTLETPQKLASWVNDVNKNLPEEIQEVILPRIYDYPLREALRRAITDPAFDVRELYNSGVRDATSLLGYNVITGVNGEQFDNKNEKPSDSDDRIEDPLLAYAYLLTNNQLGLPEIYYADYFGKESGNKAYHDKSPLKREIDQLIKAHREFIFGSTDVFYLNDLKTEKQSIYQSAVEGADAARALIFQVDGKQTPAGRAGKGSRDVLVAINFAEVPLKVIQEVNMSNLQIGDEFTDILGRSAEARVEVQDNAEFNIPNAVYLEVPPRSYSIWVRGAASLVTSETIELAAEAFDDFVELTWETPVETAIKGYEVEKSINGSAFAKIAWIPILGEAGADYLFTDEDRLPGEEIAYRVKTVYKNGTIAYSSVSDLKPEVKALTFELVENIKPSVKTIKIRSNQKGDGRFTIFNSEGKSMMAFSQAIKRGVSLAQIDLTSLPKGIYLLNIEVNDKVWTKKIINR